MFELQAITSIYPGYPQLLSMSSDQISDNRLVELLREISIQMKRDPSSRGRFMNILAGNSNDDVNRAVMWSKRGAGNMTYYQEHFGKELMPILDAMIADRKDREYRFDDFSHLSHHSLYMKVYQSLLWVIDFADPDGKYLKLRNDTELSKTKTGIRLSFIDITHPLHAHVVDKETANSYKEQINEFLANGKPGEKLQIKRLSLSEEEQEQLRVSFYGLENLLSRVSSTEILLIFKPQPTNDNRTTT